ncbi:MAG: metallophosphoesterase family protein [Xanthobacteraceae bacterium]
MANRKIDYSPVLFAIRSSPFANPMFVLAHLSDLHLGPLPVPRLAELFSKRILGFLNWHLRRHACHRTETYEAMVADMMAAKPDHIAVTGDLINIALAQEFGAARAWLDRLGTPDRVTFVPGNHDVYVRATAQHAGRSWGACMRGDDAEMQPTACSFPFVRRRGPVVLIGLSSALPTSPFLASGTLGAEQIAHLAALLPGLSDAFRVVLIHHPPLGLRPRHKRLTDAKPLLDVLAEHGAELVLHGHDHRHALNWLQGRQGRIPVVGVPSGSAPRAGREDDPAAYNLYRIEGGAGSWHCEMVSRGLRDGSTDIVELDRRNLLGQPTESIPPPKGKGAERSEAGGG